MAAVTEAVTEVRVPDIGDFKDVPVIEVMVKAGDKVKPEDPLVTLESDKATLEVPAPAAGTVAQVKIKVGDKVSEGSVILLLETGAATAASAPKMPSVAAAPPPVSAPKGVAEVRVPDIGDFKDVPVIEVLVKPGETVKAEQALVTLESDKATMDVPAPLGGVVQDVRVKVGDKVSEGAVILTLITDSAAVPPPPRGGGRGCGPKCTGTTESARCCNRSHHRRERFRARLRRPGRAQARA